MTLRAYRDLPSPPAGKQGWPWTAEGLDLPQIEPPAAWPKISIITPSYNQGAYLERTLRSVLAQQYPNLEYIVMDGGSQDESLSIIEAYTGHLDYWESQPDRGQAHALNKALTHCTGDIIAFINSDDFYLPGTLRRVGQLFASRPEVSWLSGVCEYYEEGVGYIEGGRYVRQMPPLPSDRSRWVDGWPTNQPASFWRSQCFATVGGFREDLDLVFDTEFMLRLLFAGMLPLIVDDPFAVYVLHESSKTVSQQAHYVAEADSFRPEFYKVLNRREGQRLFWRRLLRGYGGRMRAGQRGQAYAFVVREMLMHPLWFAQGLWRRRQRVGTMFWQRRNKLQQPLEPQAKS